MSRVTLPCDHAIFTSVRTPMGEGYRIIASSKGLRPEEKQFITRLSPSHEGLCVPAEEDGAGSLKTSAAAFYPLPTGRLCVSLSCFAGAEHTGRGGQRVYTHVAVFAPEWFEQVGFNPFNVWRAMLVAGLDQPQLKPPSMLEELALEIPAAPDSDGGGRLSTCFDHGAAAHVVEALMLEQAEVVELPDDWVTAAEALLLAVPGPLRAKLSFGAGMTFSVSRSHRLNVFHGDAGKARSRTSGQKIEFVDGRSVAEGLAPKGAWMQLVGRSWSEGRYGELARRTSLPFRDASPTGREVIGRLYNQIDDMPGTTAATALALAGEHLEHRGESPEGRLAAELVTKAAGQVVSRFRTEPWSQNSRLWPGVVDLFRLSAEGRELARPLVAAALESAGQSEPVEALAMGLEVVRLSAIDPAPAQGGGSPRGDFENAIEQVMRRCAEYVRRAEDFDAARIQHLCSEWKSFRPDSPHLRAIESRCSEKLAAGVQ